MEEIYFDLFCSDYIKFVSLINYLHSLCLQISQRSSRLARIQVRKECFTDGYLSLFIFLSTGITLNLLTNLHVNAFERVRENERDQK